MTRFRHKSAPSLNASLSAGLISLLILVACPAGAGDLALGSKTPYTPGPAASALPHAPAGFQPVAVILVARHGSRGLTKPEAVTAAQALWQQADAAGALTPLGRELGGDLRAFEAAQRQLGYGQLSALGQREHRELAQRLVARLPALFAGAAPLEVRSSGVERALDSAQGFLASLHEQAPQVRVPAAVPADRFLLYFHRLSESRDGAAAQRPDQRATLQRSLAYQHWLKSPALAQRLQRVNEDARLLPASRALLQRFYAPDFLAQLPGGAGALQEAAQALMEVRGAAADLALELGAARADRLVNGVPLEVAQRFTEHEDAQDFYRKGPGVLEDGPVTYGMARPLLDAMLQALPAAGGAQLNFTHAEIVAPLVSLIGVPGLHQPQPASQPYGYAHNPWRSARVIPMAANVQWEVWRNAAGERLVRQLLNETEADFKPACEGARWRAGSAFYRVAGLLACYRER